MAKKFDDLFRNIALAGVIAFPVGYYANLWRPDIEKFFSQKQEAVATVEKINHVEKEMQVTSKNTNAILKIPSIAVQIQNFEQIAKGKGKTELTMKGIANWEIIEKINSINDRKEFKIEASFHNKNFDAPIGHLSWSSKDGILNSGDKLNLTLMPGFFSELENTLPIQTSKEFEKILANGEGEIAFGTALNFLGREVLENKTEEAAQVLQPPQLKY